jgi:insertion element IS1 protein InsB
MNADTPPCPHCTSERTVKNGHIHNGKQNHRCKDCRRQFEDPQNKIISQETKELIDKLLLEKLPLAGIARVADVSEPWLQGYVNRKYKTVPKQVESGTKKGTPVRPVR